MGYWHQGPSGESFSEGSEMVWGDAPADAMGDALDRIIQAFKDDVGRAPTKAEVRAGLEFSIWRFKDDEVGVELPIEQLPAKVLEFPQGTPLDEPQGGGVSEYRGRTEPDVSDQFGLIRPRNDPYLSS
jgi:hypothetical protein